MINNILESDNRTWPPAMGKHRLVLSYIEYLYIIGIQLNMY